MLKSWAVPKGPSLNPADKRLAVETEDHPLEYIDFEGVIPEGEYGGGPMIVWDTGTWAPMDDVEKSLSTGAFKFRLAGEKLNGGWMLARLKPKAGGRDKKNWLLFKERDLPPNRGSTFLTRARKASNPAGASRSWWRRRRPAEAGQAAEAEAGRAAGRGEGPPMPARIEPQLATQIAQAAGRARAGCTRSSSTATAPWRIVDGDAVRLITRGGLDWTKRYGDLPRCLRAAAVHARPSSTARSSCSTTRASAASRRCRMRCRKGAGNKLVFYAFDLLHLDGWDLRQGAAGQAQGAAGATAGRHAGGRSAIQFSDHVEGDGRALYDQASELGLEGIVSKRADGDLSRAAASKTWTKTKALQGRRLRHRRLHRLRRRRRACGAWRSANGWMASCTIAARSAPASTPRRRRLLARLQAAARPARQSSTARRRR